MTINKAAKILTSGLIGSFVCFLGIANIGFSLAEWQKWGPIQANYANYLGENWRRDPGNILPLRRNSV
jgi:hypothetical protein